MNIPQSSIEPFGVIGIPTIIDMQERIDYALIEVWAEIWNNVECRGASLTRMLACLKKVAEKCGGRNVHCITNATDDDSGKKYINVWYKLPSGVFKAMRLFYP